MASRQSQLRSLAKQIIIARKQHNTSLHLCGNPNCEMNGRINHICTNISTENEESKPEDSLKVLAQVFDVIPRNIRLQFKMIYFHHYNTSNNMKLEFPRNLGRAMPNIQFCTISDCPNLSSLDSILDQFMNLNVLTCISCQNITSMECLSSIPNESLLTKVCFDDCGLQTTKDDWGNGLIKLGRRVHNSQPEGITLTINNCNLLTHLPPSIKLLGSGDPKAKIDIFLTNSEALQKLPHELGEVENLSSLVILNCPKIQSVPWTLGRLPNSSFGFCGNMCKELSIAMKYVKRAPETLEFPMSELQPYFKSSLKRFFIGIIRLKILLHREGQHAIQRLYQPNGKGYQKSRDNFRRLVHTEYGIRKKQKLNY